MVHFSAFLRQRLLFSLMGYRRLLAAVILLMSASPVMALEETADPTFEPLDAIAVEKVSGPEVSGPADFSMGRVDSADSLDTTAPGAAPEEAVTILGVGDLETGNPQALPSAVGGDTTAQVTSVSEFSDVLPTDWAFQALQNLVETYGCIEGYPDQTFRGARPLTRFEFAAGLSSCLNVVAQLAGSGIDPEDLAAIQRLQEEFQAELATLEGRIDTLEADVAELQAQQFSTVTKLRAQVFANLGGGFTNGDIVAEGNNIFSPTRTLPDPVTGVPTQFYRDPVTNEPFTRVIDGNPAATVGSLIWLNFDTSFTGSDLLKLQLVAGDGTAPANLYGSAGLFNTFGTPFTFQTGAPAPFEVAIRELSYKFPVGDQLTIDIGPRINWYAYFDNNRYTFFVSGANSFNSSGGTLVNAVDRGAGTVVVWDVADWLDLRLGYLSENTEFLPGQRTAGDPTRGLFGGTNTLTGQIGLRPFDDLNLRFLYTRTSLATVGGLVGGTNGEPLYGFADDGLGGSLSGGTADTFLVNFDYSPFDWLGLFGRYSYGSTGLRKLGGQIGEVNAQSYQFGLAFPDLFKEGSLATISYLVPFDVTGGRRFLVSGGGDGGTQQELEFSYRFPINTNISLMPSFYWIINPNNFSDNPDIFLFNLQAQLFF